MKIRISLPVFALAIVATCFTGSSAWAKGDANTQRNEIREMRDQVLNDLYKLKPELKSRIKKAEGYAVFTNVGVNLLIASFAGGKGIVVENGFFKDPETFMKMGSAGIGLGLGIKDFRAVFVFTAKDTMKAFVDKGWISVVKWMPPAKSDQKGGGVGAAATVVPGMEVYRITKNGIALQATIQGTKYWKDKELN